MMNLKFKTTGYLSKLAGLFIALTITLYSFAQEKQYEVLCVAFYNVENLFDTLDTPGINDVDFTPQGRNRWNTERYYDKLDNLAKVISEIGKDFTPDGPAVLGIAEVENEVVLQDLAQREAIAHRNYQIVHYYGPDRRGIDVAFMYQPKYFKVTNSKSYTLHVPDRENFRTRDQLLVSGKLHGELMHFIVTHWPSRVGGESRSRPMRIAAADLGRHIVDSLLNEDPNAKVIFMGDLNDNPNDISVTKHLRGAPDIEKMKEGDLYNPFYSFYQKGVGSNAWRDTWSLFDMVLVSEALVQNDYSTYNFFRANVFNARFLQQPRGRFRGYPFRSFAGGQYLGGYSDHFPTYVILLRER